MVALENPPSFIVRTEAQKVAFDNGFRLERGIENGWLRYASTTAKGEIWIAAATQAGSWFLSMNHPGVVAELGRPAPGVAGPGAASFAYSTLNDLYSAVERTYQLGVSLPDLPLEQFHKQVAKMPTTTEAERLVVQRVGQDIFRKALLEYWDGRCPLTGISDTALLRASHIVRWADCEDDAQRLDVHNGLLLSALWDAAFDAGRVSFTDTGEVLVHPNLATSDRKVLLDSAATRLPRLTAKHCANLAQHRARFQF